MAILFKRLAAPCRPRPHGLYAQQTRGLSNGRLRPGLKKWPCDHNYPGNKRILEYHYYPDPEWTKKEPVGGDPRGLTQAGRQVADKVRDLRFRRQLTGSTKRPRPDTPPVSQAQGAWSPPEWIVKALEQSGDTHLLYEEPTVRH